METLWETANIRWGFRKKVENEAKNADAGNAANNKETIWIQKNVHYDNLDDTFEYPVVKPQDSKAAFLPLNFPKALMEEDEDDWQVVASISFPTVPKPFEGLVYLPIGFKNSFFVIVRLLGIDDFKLFAPDFYTTDIQDTSIKITWNKVVNATGYEIYYSTKSGFYPEDRGVEKVRIEDGDITEKVFTNLNFSVPYHFKMLAIGNGEYFSSNVSMQRSATTGKKKLATPAGIRSNGVTANSISLSWDSVAGASGYSFYYGDTKDLIVTRERTVREPKLTLNGLKPNKVYYFKVSAIGLGKYSDSDRSATNGIITDKAKMSIPTGLSLSKVKSSSISVDWNTVAKASGYEVYYATTDDFAIDDAGVTKVSVVGGDSITQKLTGLSASTKYYVKVLAVGNDDFYNSDLSAQQTVTTHLATPTGISFSGINETAITMNWAKVTNASGYELYYSTSDGFAIGDAGVTKVTITSGATVSKAITGLTGHTQYYFKVLAVGSGAYVNSELSAQQTASTSRIKLATPTVTSFSRITTTSITMNWRLVANASGYEIYYSTTNGFAISDAGVTKVSISGATIGKAITGLTGGAQYYFKILAVGSGAYSNSDASTQQTAATAPIERLSISSRGPTDASNTVYVFQGDDLDLSATASSPRTFTWQYKKRVGATSWNTLTGASLSNVSLAITAADFRVGAYRVKVADQYGNTSDDFPAVVRLAGCPAPSTTNKPATTEDLKTLANSLTGNDLQAIDTSQITSMSRLFKSKTTFNRNISCWDTSRVTDIRYMFYGANAFNQDIGAWDTSRVTDMRYLFNEARAFNQDIGTWDTSRVTDMRFMFYEAMAFNQDIGAWNISRVTTMRYMFYEARAFNQNISGWNTSKVTECSNLFLSSRLTNSNKPSF